MLCAGVFFPIIRTKCGGRAIHGSDFHLGDAQVTSIPSLGSITIGGGWRKQAVITARRFRSSSAAWVSDIHSLDPGNGTAIIKIAEEIEMVPPIHVPQSLIAAVMGTEKFSRPVDKGFRVQYSWVSWDIRANKKMEILCLCANPNDPYER